ncbi:unnamed protein product [Trypanosoma congolense IL3000]|uniref:Thymidine kinase n=1 Tax=Trypanosoma congolense (strain IL3000) TaxID=1068625 RepID=F9WAY4_TRYCI|nr:unnamed protein product [Trypanosoma congolense IL3000]
MTQSPQSGRIELVIGPMFAGKTTELMSRVNRNYLASHSCYVIKYSKDVRYSKESISTHDQRTLTATVSVTKLSEVGNAWREYDVIAVDEGQFFQDILEFCSMAANAGKKVIVAALDGDYRNEPFENIAKLIPAAESVTKLSAVCMSCKSCDAYFTHRTVQSEQRELIGGADMYISTCRACYNRLNNQGGSLAEDPKGPQGGVAVSHTVEDANELRSPGADVASVDAACRDSGGSRTATSRSLPDAKLPGKRQRSPLESPSSPVDEKPVRKLC